MLGHRHRVKALRALGHVDVAAHEVHEIRALHQQLRHPGVVVALARDVTIGARLGFRGAHRVRIVRAEAEAAEAFRRDGLLHVIEPVAIGVLRADHHRARRARRRDAMLGHRAIHAQHVDVVAQHLEVVGGVVARGQPFVVQHRHLAVGRPSADGSRSNWWSRTSGRRSRSCGRWHAPASIHRPARVPHVVPSFSMVFARRDFSL